MSREYFLGVDVGATKCHALVANRNGNAVGFGSYGAGNYEVVGWDGLRQALNGVTQNALASAGIIPSQLAGAGFGIAGYDWPGERAPHIKAIASLGLPVPYALVNDTIIGLVAGTAEGWGIGVVSGTGSNCWGRAKDGREGQMTGGGDLFAEYAGGSDLVHKAIQCVALAWSRRGPATKLTDVFVSLTGARDGMDLLEGIMLERYDIGSDAAPLIFKAAAEGDQVAENIITWAGRELGSLAVGVARQLSFEPLPVEVVQIGSLFNGSPVLGETMMATLRKVVPQAKAVRLHAPPVVGAVFLGMEQAGVDFVSMRQSLIESTQSILREA
jgi:N-acetylglucosamine kinase-like BadF-type ATPase